MRVRIAAFNGPVLIGIFIVLTSILVFLDNGKTDESQSAGLPGVNAKEQNVGPTYMVTPVSGPSWLKQIEIFDIRLTAMGEMGGYDPPPRSPRKEPNFPVEEEPPGGRMRMGMGKMMERPYSNYRSDPSEVERLILEG